MPVAVFPLTTKIRVLSNFIVLAVYQTGKSVMSRSVIQSVRIFTCYSYIYRDYIYF